MRTRNQFAQMQCKRSSNSKSEPHGLHRRSRRRRVRRRGKEQRFKRGQCEFGRAQVQKAQFSHCRCESRGGKRKLKWQQSRRRCFAHRCGRCAVGRWGRSNERRQVNNSVVVSDERQQGHDVVNEGEINVFQGETRRQSNARRRDVIVEYERKQESLLRLQRRHITHLSNTPKPKR